MLAPLGRRLLVVDPAEVDDDLVRDVTEILTSLCARLHASLTLSERTFTCQSCGLVGDRDLNAAVNLSNLVAASTSETVNARGADRKTPSAGRAAGKREPGTAPAGQTGSASPQGEAA
ncbi:putative transposase DNA-binding domain [Frankia sp. CeD]|nr:putative transposase DNA-binding domain [Frankia sp. CeD]